MVARLEDIAAEIQDGKVGLEASVALYEEGKALASRCADRLTAAQKRIELISPDLLEKYRDPQSRRDTDDADDSNGDNVAPDAPPENYDSNGQLFA